MPLAETGLIHAWVPVFLLSTDVFLPAMEMERWSDGQRTKIMVIRIAFVLGPDRLDEAALRGGSGAVELRRGNAKLSNGASPPPRLSMYCVSSVTRCRRRRRRAWSRPRFSG